MNLSIFIILSVAVWYISLILTHEAGPYKIIEKFRNSIINEPWSPIHCIRCTSVWVSFVISVFIFLSFNIPFIIFFIVWFGASGGAMLIDYTVDMYLDREEKK